ncbi:glycosyltransferase, partial [Acinetobacter baumannii]
MVASAALAFSKHRKALFWRFLQQPAYASAAAWHATSHAEADDIRRMGVAAPIAIIPNGVDVSDALDLAGP